MRELDYFQSKVYDGTCPRCGRTKILVSVLRRTGGVLPPLESEVLCVKCGTVQGVKLSDKALKECRGTFGPWLSSLGYEGSDGLF